MLIDKLLNTTIQCLNEEVPKVPKMSARLSHSDGPKV